MKLNKSKKKGKVHPSPSSSSSSTTSNNENPISSLNHLLPTAIFTLISVLSLQDREVLAYMITHSLKSSTLNYPSSFDQKINPKKKPNRKTSTNSHKSPSFDCGCFDCYTSFWCRWDSSPHRELIHQAIEAFEEHLSSSEKTKKKSSSCSRTREKNGNCSSTQAMVGKESSGPLTPEVVFLADNDVEEREITPSPVNLAMVDVEVRETEPDQFPVAGEEQVESGTQEKELQQQQQQHKGLARKVLPDFIGIFQSRLWNRLWGPNV
ncbi:uncharacterized protein LOC130808907 [Amaranthus tricolor]|uniref:uncharacterized protein LOC130808907 n=1 Tax=Amaranthus tricolor TaxID=29722 RepID=UPI00258DAD20|nr:uncharacterized protein LOC130808907 [Amaranthus tricolor]